MARCSQAGSSFCELCFDTFFSHTQSATRSTSPSPPPGRPFLLRTSVTIFIIITRFLLRLLLLLILIVTHTIIIIIIVIVARASQRPLPALPAPLIVHINIPQLHKSLIFRLVYISITSKARSAALRPEEVEAVRQIDPLAWATKNRIVCISLHVIANFSLPKPRPRQQRVRAPQVQVQDGENSSGHDLKVLFNRVVSTKCLKTGPKHRALGWVDLPCKNIFPEGLCPSHQRHFIIYRDLFLCFKCGSWGRSRLVNLMKPCDRLSPTGKQFLKRICKGKRSYDLQVLARLTYDFPSFKKGPSRAGLASLLALQNKLQTQLNKHTHTHTHTSA